MLIIHEHTVFVCAGNYILDAKKNRISAFYI